MNKFMRLIVMFDLPVTTAQNRKAAAGFRNFLVKDGYAMMQFSVYVRICNGVDAVNKHRARLDDNVPDNGSVRCLVVTEKQFESMALLIGKLTVADESAMNTQITFF